MLTNLPVRRLAAWALLSLLTLPGWSAAQPSSPGAAAAYSSAAALQDQGLYDLAAKEWQGLLKAHPTDPLAPRARYNLGACRFQQGDFAAAAQQFEQAAAAKGAEPIAESAWANLGLARFNQAASLPADQSAQAREAYQGAIKAFDKLLADFPQTSQGGAARFYRAESHAALGEPKPAAEDYRAVLVEVSAATLHDAARLGLASAELDLNQPQQAEATLNTLVAARPAAGVLGEALRLRGEARLATKRYKEAAEDFGQASGIDGYAAAADARERQAFALYSGGDYAGAAGAYQELAKQFPQSPLAAGAQLAAGKCLVLGKQSGEAAFLLGALWRANPSADNAEAAHWLTQTLLGSQQWAEASEVARQAIDTQPTDQWAFPLQLALADALLEQPERQAEALAAYQALSQQHAGTPTGERAEYLAAYTALELGQNDLAWQLASGFLKQRPQHRAGRRRPTGRRRGGNAIGKEQRGDRALPKTTEELPQRSARRRLGDPPGLFAER